MDNKQELIKLIRVLDDNSEFTDTKIDDILSSDDSDIDEWLLQVKLLSDYYVKYKILTGKIPFSIDVDIINNNLQILINNIFENIVIPKGVYEVRIGNRLIDKLTHNKVTLDLRNVTKVHFHYNILSYNIMSTDLCDAIIRGSLLLNNKHLNYLENKLIYSQDRNTKSLVDVIIPIIKYHMKQIGCKDAKLLKDLAEIENYIKAGRHFTKRAYLTLYLIDNLYEWSKHNNVT